MPAPVRLDAHVSGAALFGAELRILRESREWTQTEAGERLGWSTATIASVETARRKPPLGLGERLDAEFGLPGTLARMAAVARATHSWLDQYVDLEAEATYLRIWDMRVVHGLFQTEDYARALLAAGRPRGTTDDALEHYVTERLARQAILRRESPPTVTYVLSEAVLRQPVGGVPLMRAQIAALIDAAQLPNVTIQVLPFSAGAHPGCLGPFTILDFAAEPPIALAEAMNGGRLIDQQAELADVTRFYNAITAAALSPEASIGMMISAMETLWTPRT